MKQGAIICTVCGYNRETETNIRTRIEKLPREKKSSQSLAALGNFADRASIAFAPVLWLAGGVAGTVVGCIVWFAVAKDAGNPMTFMAIVVGLCAGVGTAILGKRTLNPASGIVAATCALIGAGINYYGVFGHLVREQGEAVGASDEEIEEATNEAMLRRSTSGRRRAKSLIFLVIGTAGAAYALGAHGSLRRD